MAQTLKNLPISEEDEEMRIRSLGWENPLEKEMAIHSSILACKTPWTVVPGGLLPMGSQRVRYDRDTATHTVVEEHQSGSLRG